MAIRSKCNRPECRKCQVEHYCFKRSCAKPLKMCCYGWVCQPSIGNLTVLACSLRISLLGLIQSSFAERRIMFQEWFRLPAFTCIHGKLWQLHDKTWAHLTRIHRPSCFSCLNVTIHKTNFGRLSRPCHLLVADLLMWNVAIPCMLFHKELERKEMQTVNVAGSAAKIVD